MIALILRNHMFAAQVFAEIDLPVAEHVVTDIFLEADFDKDGRVGAKT